MQRAYFYINGHNCTLNYKYFEEEYDVIVENSWIVQAFLISSDNPKTYQTFNSQASITRERRRHVEYDRFVIHPFSAFQTYWQMIMIFQLSYTFILLPLLYWTRFIYLNDYLLVADIIYLIHICIMFNTGYYNGTTDNLIELRREPIVIHYLRGKFPIDFISTLASLLIVIIVDGNGKAIAATPGFMIAIRAIATLKIWRIFLLMEYLYSALEFLKYDDDDTRDICVIMGYGFFAVHLASCAQLSGAIQLNIFTEEMLTHEDYDEETLKWLQYIYEYGICAYRTLCALSGSGVAGFNPTTMTDRLFVIAALIIGRFYIILAMSKIYNIIHVLTFSSGKHKIAAQNQLMEFMNYNRLPNRIKMKVNYYFEQHHVSSYFHEAKIFSHLENSSIKADIISFKTRHLINNLDFFRTIPRMTAVHILSCLKFDFIQGNDKLYLLDDVDGTHTLFFVLNGTLALYSPSGIEVCHITDGEFTGELCLLTNERQRLCTCIAVETTTLLIMNREDFTKVIMHFPDLEESFTKVAAKRMEDILLLEDQLKRHVFQPKEILKRTEI